MRAIVTSHQADPCHPFIDKPGVLAGAKMPIMVNPAGKDIIVHRAAPPIEPSQQASPCVGEQFELNGSTCFLLHDDRTRSDLPAADDVAKLHLHQIAAPKFAVDRQVK